MKTPKLLFTLLLVVLFYFSAKAQIVYTDINPDATATLGVGGMSGGNVASIDFNNDGTEEYNFRWDDNGATGWFMHMTYANGNEFNLKGTAVNPYGGRYIQPMNAGQNINSAANWGNSYPEPFIGDNAAPNFKGLGDKYVGVKFFLGANTHYGWVLVSFDNNKKITVKEYAYESTPNKAIKAGDKGNVGINTIKEKSSINVYPNPAKNTVFVNLKNTKDISKIKIYSILGKEVKSVSITNANLQKIDISELKKGIYFVNIFCDDKIIDSKKLIII